MSILPPMDEIRTNETRMEDKGSSPIFSNELAYAVGIIAVAFGVAFMEKANFGVSMVVAPAYLLHRCRRCCFL